MFLLFRLLCSPHIPRLTRAQAQWQQRMFEAKARQAFGPISRTAWPRRKALCELQGTDGVRRGRPMMDRVLRWEAADAAGCWMSRRQLLVSRGLLRHQHR